MFVVEVKAIGGYTLHSTHRRYRDAVDQADMVHGRVVMTIEITLAHLLREYSPEIVRDVIDTAERRSRAIAADMVADYVFANEAKIHAYCARRRLQSQCQILAVYLSDVVWLEVVECLMGE